MINQLMQNEKARDIYLTIPSTMDPAAIADNYLQAKLSGDNATMLAYEAHMRDLARVQFQSTAVLRALADIERYKVMRKPGKGGARMLQDIAGEIERAYTAGEFQCLADGRIKFKIGRLAVTCKDLPGAVALVAAKYRRGLPRTGPGRYGSNNWPK